MTITCPVCQASYRIDAEALGDGRKVRCARCRAEWIAGPVATASADGELEIVPPLDEAFGIDMIERAGDEPDGTRDAVVLPSDRRRAPKRKGLVRAAAFAPAVALRRALAGVRPIALFAGLGLAAFGFMIGERASIVRAAPSLASLYSAVGLPVNVRGLTIGQIRSIEQIENGVPLLLVMGAVENVSKGPLAVPRLRLAVTGRDGRELYAWTTMAGRATLAAGESAPFRARLASPPAEGAAISVRFLASSDQASIASR